MNVSCFWAQNQWNLTQFKWQVWFPFLFSDLFRVKVAKTMILTGVQSNVRWVPLFSSLNVKTKNWRDKTCQTSALMYCWYKLVWGIVSKRLQTRVKLFPMILINPYSYRLGSQSCHLFNLSHLITKNCCYLYINQIILVDYNA